MSIESEMAELSLLYHSQRAELDALRQLIRDYRQFVREGDSRNTHVPIVHADATIDVLERRASELIGE